LDVRRIGLRANRRVDIESHAHLRRLLVAGEMNAGLLSAGPRPPDYMAAGSPERCDGCDERIASNDLEYGVRLVSRRVLHLHRCCYWAWFDACTTTKRGQ
jgi:hypothetical protein